MADGTCWAQLHLPRDSSAGFFSADDAGFVAEVAPSLPPVSVMPCAPVSMTATPPPRDDPAEPGTIIVDEELSVGAATPGPGT